MKPVRRLAPPNLIIKAFLFVVNKNKSERGDNMEIFTIISSIITIVLDVIIIVTLLKLKKNDK